MTGLIRVRQLAYHLTHTSIVHTAMIKT